MPEPQPGRESILRLIPSIDEILQTAEAHRIVGEAGQRKLLALARAACESLRNQIKEEAISNGTSKSDLLASAVKSMQASWSAENRSGLRRVINATGVIVHTNLGRAPLSENAKKAILEQASGYCTLEYDLQTGKRGKRGARAEMLLAEITCAEAAVIVNNCAAAAFLVLTVFAKGKGVVISRGELVEIGGDFRVPDVLAQSGAYLQEVGTTNRTKLSDYEKAITENTGMILRVHPSNYKIVGFTESPDLSALAELAPKKDLLLYEDAGSGAMLDLSEFGLNDEPVIAESISAGVDIATFSGDKLLGGVQAGMIVGRKPLIDSIRKHPLYRALRVDKLAYAAIEATLDAYARETALTEVPVLKMLSMTKQAIEERTSRFAQRLGAQIDKDSDLKIQVIDGTSLVGGGSAPGTRADTALLALIHTKMSEVELERALRFSETPVIARILEDRVVIDLRTVCESEEDELFDILTRLSRFSRQNPS